MHHRIIGTSQFTNQCVPLHMRTKTIS